MKSFRDNEYDERRLAIESFQFLPVVFPFTELEGMETRYGRDAEGTPISQLMSQESEFTVYVDAPNKPLDRDDMLFWLIENYSGPRVDSILPTMLMLRVVNMVSHFGTYGIIFQGYKCTVGDVSTMPTQLRDALVEAYYKRRPQFLADHARTQIEFPG
ncbi:MAG: hypothetical protein LC687_00425 [Actinobacteria bacterium]|nr:hypothetical protein [Actinomycetota bacterium]MCA1806335.1 hypothetical protein [Actinomycetota bacterium]